MNPVIANTARHFLMRDSSLCNGAPTVDFPVTSYHAVTTQENVKMIRNGV